MAYFVYIYYYFYKRVAIKVLSLHNISLTVATLSNEIINPKNINIMEYKTNVEILKESVLLLKELENKFSFIKLKVVQDNINTVIDNINPKNINYEN